MSTSFQDIRLKAQQKSDYKSQIEICAKVVSDYCLEVYKAFEAETSLEASDHYRELLYTPYFLEHFTFLKENAASFEYTIRNKSFFKDAIKLKGTVYFNKVSTAYLHFHIDGPSDDPLSCIKQFTSIISAKLAQVKGN